MNNNIYDKSEYNYDYDNLCLHYFSVNNTVFSIKKLLN